VVEGGVIDFIADFEKDVHMAVFSEGEEEGER
jgi:hypothetical protein